MSELDLITASKREMWSCLSCEEDVLRLMGIIKEDIEILAAQSDGCISIEEWVTGTEDDNVVIAFKGTEGLRKFSQFISEVRK